MKSSDLKIKAWLVVSLAMHIFVIQLLFEKPNLQGHSISSNVEDTLTISLFHQRSLPPSPPLKKTTSADKEPRTTFENTNNAHDLEPSLSKDFLAQGTLTQKTVPAQKKEEPHRSTQHSHSSFRKTSSNMENTAIQKDTEKRSVRELLTLLHAAINQRMHYPYSAKKRRQEGITRLKFKVQPNGSIESITTERSSNINTLDLAAINAVRNITPFLPAKEFLSSSREFEVDIVFKL